MKNLHYHLRRDGWVSENGFLIRGCAFDGMHLMTAAELASRCAGHLPYDRLSEAVRSIVGFYAIVHEDERSVTLVADPARSMPLLYAVVGDQVHVGDDPEAMLAAVGSPEVDASAATEYLLIGYVTGEETLYQGIRQIQAGEIVHIGAKADGSLDVSQIRYYRYRACKETPFPDDDHLMERLDAVVVKAFERLVAFAGGRTIAVALSGGFDSRLIMLMLKRLDYPHVLAFSYGRPNNPESEISRRVAEHLGMRWEFVPYSNEFWSERYHSRDYEAYRRGADNLSAQPYLQDWMAVEWLRDRGIVPRDTVFVSGVSFPSPLMFWHHTEGQSRVYDSAAHPGEQEIDRVVGDIIATEYIIFDWSAHADELRPIIEERVQRSLGPLDAYPDRTSALESWLITERQGKFITNSARTYEFLGFAWWFPLWDQEFRDLWEHVPLTQRYNRRLYEEYVTNLSARYFSEPIKTMYQPSVLIRLLRKTLLHPSALGGLEHVLYLRRKQKTMYDTHPLGWYGIVPRERFNAIAPKVVNLMTILNVEKIERLAERSKVARSLLKFAPFRLT